MSRLSEELRATPGRERRPSRYRRSMIQVEESEQPAKFGYRQEYKIEAHLGGTVFLDEPLASVPSAVEEAKESVRRALIEHVFGEFREPLARLSMALYNDETDEAQEIVSDIRRTMFDG